MTEDHNLSDLNHRINDRGYFERILQERKDFDIEREKRLDERFEGQEKAVAAALTAQKEATTVALSSAEKAVDKAEQAQLRVNVTQNEFRATLKDQAADLMPRSETELLVRDLRSQIDLLKSFQNKVLGLALAAPFLTGVVVYLITKN